MSKPTLEEVTDEILKHRRFVLHMSNDLTPLTDAQIPAIVVNLGAGYTTVLKADGSQDHIIPTARPSVAVGTVAELAQQFHDNLLHAVRQVIQSEPDSFKGEGREILVAEQVGDRPTLLRERHPTVLEWYAARSAGRRPAYAVEPATAAQRQIVLPSEG